MTNTRTFTVQNPDDLLAVVPCILGFHPEDSLVMMTTAGEGDQFHARVDLPEDDLGEREVVDHLTGVARRNGVRRVALVAYTDDACLAEDLVLRLDAGLTRDGVSVVLAVRADGERWYAVTDRLEPCCPPDGRPYDVTSHRFTAQSVLDGQVTLRNRQELADSLVGTDPDAFDAVAEAADRAMDRFYASTRPSVDPAGPDPVRSHLVAEGWWVRERVRGYLADGRPLDDEEAGRMLVGLVATDVRDVAWAEMSRDNAAVHVSLWRDVVRRAPHDLLAAPAALLGFAAWLAGDGALAWCAVERCQSVEPDYRLAALLADALLGAVPPSRWEPVPRDALPLFAD